MKTKEEVFNEHSFLAIGAISPSKDFCLKAMDEYAKQQAVDFFKWYGLKMASFLEYLTKIKSITESKEIEEAIKNHEGATFEQLYNQFIESQNK